VSASRGMGIAAARQATINRTHRPWLNPPLFTHWSPRRARSSAASGVDPMNNLGAVKLDAALGRAHVRELPNGAAALRGFACSCAGNVQGPRQSPPAARR
jgi:hypothetical protein